ncbi:ATP-binding protein [Kitasatospora sp. NPDC004240]
MGAVPRLLTKDIYWREKIRDEMHAEFRSLLRVLLEKSTTTQLHVHTHEGDGRVTFQYEVTGAAESVLANAEAAQHYLPWRITSGIEPCPLSDEDTITLVRTVALVPVGRIAERPLRSVPLLRPGDPRHITFSETAGTPYRMVDALLTPVLEIIRAEMANLLPKQVHRVPLPVRGEFRTFATGWRDLAQALAVCGGCVTIELKRHELTSDDIDYAGLCWQYFMATANQQSAREAHEQSSVLRALYSAERVVLGEVRISGPDPVALHDAFLRDVSTQGFEPVLTSSLEDALIDMIVEMRDRRGREEADQAVEVVRRICRYFTVAEAVELLCPPFSVDHSLAGVSHVHPHPFARPERSPSKPVPGVDIGCIGSRTIHIAYDDLCRHVFVTGSPGSGKTSTMAGLAYRLRHERPDLPMLIIDPAKRDFEPLMDKLAREGLADSRSVIDFRRQSLRFNPFLPADHVRIYDHAVVLARSLAMLSPANAVAYDLLLSIIRRLYWFKLQGEIREPTLEEVADFQNVFGVTLRQHPWMCPTFDDFLAHWQPILESHLHSQDGSRFAAEAVEHFARRVDALKQSRLRVMLTPAHDVVGLDPVFDDICLLQFGDWYDEDETNAAFALVFAMLYERRQSDHRTGLRSPGLRHLAVIDEAHRLVPAQAKGGSSELLSSREEVAQLFGHMIAECRSLGQGLVLGEQSASAIHPSVLVNTATKIIHRVSYGRDKAVLAEALDLSPAEAQSMSNLVRPEALAYLADGSHAIHMSSPYFDVNGG